MKADAKEEKAILQRLTDEEFDFIAVLDIEHETIDFRTINSHANPPLSPRGFTPMPRPPMASSGVPCPQPSSKNAAEM